MNPLLSAFAFLSGTLVGISGVGGGSLVTPVLILVFGVSPLAAVSSDLAATLIINPFGGGLHAARRRVDRSLLSWLCVGSVPAAFSGALLLSLIPGQVGVNTLVRLLVGITLGLTAITILLRVLPSARAGADRAAGPAGAGEAAAVRIRPIPVMALGALAGLLVGLTSIGAGSIIAAGLLLLFPRLPVARIVGTDVVHTIPMVAAATLGHLLFGQVHFAVTLSLIAGGVPGVLLGSFLTGKVPALALRSALGVLLATVSLSLLHTPLPFVFAGAAATAVVVTAVAGVRRPSRGQPATTRAVASVGSASSGDGSSREASR